MNAVEINVACAVENLPENIYHADPVQGGSVSYTGMKELLKSPAHYRHYMDSPRVQKPASDEGHIVHALVLGTPLDVTVIPSEILASNGATSTKAAKQFIEEARLDGLTPVKAGDLEPLERVAEAVLAHPTARVLFEHEGPTELSMFAPDPVTGVWVRGRADKVSEWEGETILVDLKTTPDADPREFNRGAVARFRYYLQAAVYGWLYQATNPMPVSVPEMLFVAVSKTEPHLVSVNRLDWAYDDLGQTAMRTALNTYKACMNTGEWPGYPTEVSLLEPPTWLIYENDEAIEVPA